MLLVSDHAPLPFPLQMAFYSVTDRFLIIQALRRPRLRGSGMNVSRT